MGRTILSGNPPIEVALRRSARARRMTLRVSRLDGRVTLSVPAHVPDREAAEFARAREAWLRDALSEVPGSERVGPGSRLPLAGQTVTVEIGGGRRARCEDGRLIVPGRRPGAEAAAILKATARDRLAAASDRYAGRLGVGYAALSLRDTRSRWGSCTAERRLMYSWRLIMAPPDVLDYVAAHEVAHLVHMDHSPAFWSVVAELCPDHAGQRRWLREHGPGLHRFVFTD